MADACKPTTPGGTDEGFELAQRIEEMATWLPSEGICLHGPPKSWVKSPRLTQ
jgi:hypothetical protein